MFRGKKKEHILTCLAANTCTFSDSFTERGKKDSHSTDISKSFETFSARTTTTFSCTNNIHCFCCCSCINSSICTNGELFPAGTPLKTASPSTICCGWTCTVTTATATGTAGHHNHQHDDDDHHHHHRVTKSTQIPHHTSSSCSHLFGKGFSCQSGEHNICILKSCVRKNIFALDGYG